MSSDSSSHPTPSPGLIQQLTKISRGGTVPARHFIDEDEQDFTAEGPHPGRRAINMKILATVAFSAVVLVIVAAVAMNIYHHKEEVIPEVKDFDQQSMADVKEFAKQRMADVDDLWANTDLGEYKNYFVDLFKWERSKKYVVEVTRRGNYIMDLFRGKKIEKFNVKITGT